MSEDEIEWCRTQGGTFVGYEAEFFNGIEWLPVPYDLVPDGHGVKHPRRNGGILSTIMLHGKAQAKALAWTFAASAESQGEQIQIRLQKYEIVYDIKARKVLENEE